MKGLQKGIHPDYGPWMGISTTPKINKPLGRAEMFL
jgi:hypothetical protein